MGFRENLKNELAYLGMPVKELAALSGVNKRTIDNYLNTRKHIPSAEIAVTIALVLGVSVEYLITGEEKASKKPLKTQNSEGQTLLQIFNMLEKEDQKLVLLLAKSLKERQRPTKNQPPRPKSRT
jgi:transcriptional regulator with XRE-family HTH domain